MYSITVIEYTRLKLISLKGLIFDISATDKVTSDKPLAV